MFARFLLIIIINTFESAWNLYLIALDVFLYIFAIVKGIFFFLYKTYQLTAWHVFDVRWIIFINHSNELILSKRFIPKFCINLHKLHIARSDQRLTVIRKLCKRIIGPCHENMKDAWAPFAWNTYFCKLVKCDF